MNFYASREYLDAVASVYFKGRDTAIEDVRIGDDVLRLLVVDGRHVATRLQFLDYHQPLAEAEIRPPLRDGRYAEEVVRGTIACEDWSPQCYPGTDIAPFVDWSQFSSLDDYGKWLRQRRRGLMRDYERRLQKLADAHGEVAFVMNDTSDDVLPFVRQWKSRQLVETGKDDYFALPETMAFLRTLRERGVLVSSTLRVGGRLASAWIGYVFEGSWSGWIFTYDLLFRKFSVGHQLLHFMLEESFRRGHREFDFSAGGEDYKLAYATHGRLLGAIGHPPLAKAASDSIKRQLRTHAPALFAAAQRAKRSLKHALRKRIQSGDCDVSA